MDEFMAKNRTRMLANIKFIGELFKLKVCYSIKRGYWTYKKNSLKLYRVYQKKGNPILAWHCALITGCMNVILHGHKDQGLIAVE